jgi:hypothetical protein
MYTNYCGIFYLYNNTPSNAIVNAASDITYRPVIEAANRGCCTLIIAFLNKLLIFFFNKAYYQESCILIIKYSSVITVAEWLEGSFESQSRRRGFSRL